MKILVVGGTGLIGSHLKNQLLRKGVTVNLLSRKKSRENNIFLWDIKNNYIDLNAFKEVSGIINLTGANIANGKWTSKRKRILYDSRILSTRFLFETVKKNNILIDFFISSSAVGYYGTKKSSLIFKEDDRCGIDFLAKLCFDWEKEALRFNELNIRTVLIRTGIVLTKYKGALEKIKLPIKFGILPLIGTGKQSFPWIHIEDLIAIISNSINNKKYIGPYNAVAPIAYTSYLELNTKIAELLDKRIIRVKIPTILLNFAFGKLSDTLTNGNQIAADKLIAIGFNFKYKKLESALSNLLVKN